MISVSLSVGSGVYFRLQIDQIVTKSFLKSRVGVCSHHTSGSKKYRPARNAFTPLLPPVMEWQAVPPSSRPFPKGFEVLSLQGAHQGVVSLPSAPLCPKSYVREEAAPQQSQGCSHVSCWNISQLTRVCAPLWDW